MFKESQSSTVGIATRLPAGDSGDRIALRATDFHFLQNVQFVCGAHAASDKMRTGVLPRS
jgi:hypothetical protein